jgi:hypothetical protein
MARKELRIKMTNAGRDEGKTFVITEMSARKAHAWATRALFALLNGGLEIPDNIAEAGFAGLATMGIEAIGKIPFDAAEPQLAELLQCVKIAPDPAHPDIVRNCIDDDFEEFATIFRLQKETLSLHIDFFTRAAQ